MKNQFIRTVFVRLSGLLIMTLGVLLLFFGNGQEANSLPEQSSVKTNSGIYELLRLHVPRETRQAWLNADARGNLFGFLGHSISNIFQLDLLLLISENIVQRKLHESF